MNPAMTRLTVSALVHEQHDRYAEQEKALRERGYVLLADYLRAAQARLDDLQTQISMAQEPSAIKEVHQQSLVVAGDSCVFTASQMKL